MVVLSIFGTRPEAIKMAPVIKELERHSDAIESIICVTGQHRQMLDQVLMLFGIEPQIDLNLMEPNQKLAYFTAKALTKLADVITDTKPELVLLQGDTTTAMVGTLAGFYQKVPIGHIEAGLRTHDRYNPFPEEINRRLTSVMATYNFAPTQTAANALLADGVPEENIFLTGNTVIDALLMIVNGEHQLKLDFLDPGKKIILITAHRRENFGKPLINICEAIKDISVRNPEIEIVYPVHLNPNVRSVVYSILSNQDRIHLIEPLGYKDFAYLMDHSYFILTDSGGIQEEAPALGKPVLVLRNETERPEAVKAGVVKIIGTGKENIVSETEKLLNDNDEYDIMSKAISPYGDGHAAERIIEIILGRMSYAG